MPDIDNQRSHRGLRGKATAAMAAFALLAFGGAVGAVAMHGMRPSVTMAPVKPVAINALQAGNIVTIKGRVAEIYGNKFIVQDAGGRALVETGREGEDGKLVAPGEPVVVQGRFEQGFVRAAFVVGPDSKVVALGPLGGPHEGHERHGPKHGPDRPPEQGPDADGPRDARDAAAQGSPADEEVLTPNPRG
jgi:uncharacterized protein YdeI (BOF family)